MREKRWSDEINQMSFDEIREVRKCLAIKFSYVTDTIIDKIEIGDIFEGEHGVWFVVLDYVNDEYSDFYASVLSTTSYNMFEFRNYYDFVTFIENMVYGLGCVKTGTCLSAPDIFNDAIREVRKTIMSKKEDI